MTNIEETFKTDTVSGRFWNSPHKNVDISDLLISDEARRVLELIFYVFLCGILGIFGSATNVINAIIFCKQGFKDSVNISLFSLTLSDLGVVVTMTWSSICHNPLFRYSNIEFDSNQVEYITAGWTSGVFVRITSWITVIISLERCICIALPLKVKNIITPKRTLIIVVVIYFIMVTSAFLFFSSIYFTPSFVPERNKTLIGISYNSKGPVIEITTSSINVALQLSAVFIVVICATVLIFSLQSKSHWRQKLSSPSSSFSVDSLSSRDKRVMKMVTFIATVFIICYLPEASNLFLMVYRNPDYSVVGKYHNSYSVSWSIVYTLETLNSSVTIFIYYNMSSKFRETFNTCFMTSSIDNKSV